MRSQSGRALRSCTSAMSLFGELIAATRVQDLSGCRSLCGIPASVTRKKDLVEALQLQALCPHKRRAVIQHLTGNMTANGLRSWISSLRRAGFVVPDSRVMNGARADIVDAIIRLDCPAGEYSSAQGQRASATTRVVDASVRLDCPAGEYSSAQGQGPSAAGRADSVGEISSAQGGEAPWGVPAGLAGECSSAQGQADSAGQSASSGDIGMVMVAYDAGSSPEASRRKLGKKWMKLARKAFMRSHLPQRVRSAVEEALREYPDATVLKLREVVESRIGVGLHGKYGALFDKALLRGTAKPVKPHRPRKRFVLAVGRRRAKGAPATV